MLYSWNQPTFYTRLHVSLWDERQGKWNYNYIFFWLPIASSFLLFKKETEILIEVLLSLTLWKLFKFQERTLEDFPVKDKGWPDLASDSKITGCQQGYLVASSCIKDVEQKQLCPKLDLPRSEHSVIPKLPRGGRARWSSENQLVCLDGASSQFRSCRQRTLAWARRSGLNVRRAIGVGLAQEAVKCSGLSSSSAMWGAERDGRLAPLDADSLMVLLHPHTVRPSTALSRLAPCPAQWHCLDCATFCLAVYIKHVPLSNCCHSAKSNSEGHPTVRNPGQELRLLQCVCSTWQGHFALARAWHHLFKCRRSRGPLLQTDGP